MFMEPGHSIIKDWLKAPEARGADWLKPLRPEERFLLFSGGSTTLELEVLLGRSVAAEVTKTGFARLGPDDALYLGEGPLAPALERSVWLKAGDKRLVFAHTVMPVESLDRGLLKELSGGKREPLGRILSSMGIPAVKEGIEAALINCPEACAGFSIEAGTPLFAKRYLLKGGGGPGASAIKAAVFEVFTPRLVSGPYLRN